MLTDKDEDFTRNDIVRGLARYIDDPFAIRSAIDQVMGSSELIKLSQQTPPLYTTRKILATKAALADHVQTLSRNKGTAVPARHINAAIRRQNRNLQSTLGVSLSDQQVGAIRHCLKLEQISAIVGLAGAGKSTMLSAVREAYDHAGYNVRGAALSGKAADGLESASGIQSRTLASLEHSWKSGFGRLSAKDVLVIDEVGMIGSRQMLRFVQEVKQSGAKLILVGDPEQLQPINAGAPFKEITNQIDVAHLTEIHRQKQDWQKQASLDLAEMRIEQALNAYEVHGHVKQTRDTSSAISALVEDYMVDLASNKDASRLALTYRHKDVHAIHQAIRFARRSSGELSNERVFKTTNGKRAFAAGDRILLTQNDRSLGVRNGMFGNVQSVSEDKLVIAIDIDGNQPQRLVTIMPELYPHFDHGYASTIHKSQGATVDRTFVLGSPLMDRHLTYVAMTRHREETTLYGDRNSLQK